MNKYTKYDEIKKNLKEHDGKVEPYKEINYGIQFEVSALGYTSKVRIYESKKKGITVDLSQVKYEALRELILNINSNINSNEKSIDNSEKNTSSKEKSIGLLSDQFKEALIGVDESGKGDYFGPLVIGAVYADEEMKRKLINMGVADSKKLNDSQIHKIAEQIKSICEYEVIVVHNEAYNRLYEKIKNLNHLLAKGHAKIIETLAKRTKCKLALSDQFGNESLIHAALKPYQLDIKLEQRPKAESNIVVAAASILARDAFVVEMEKLSEKYDIELPKGAGSITKTRAKKIVSKYGKEELFKVVKLHFKTTNEL
ncbi:MAG: ribonuclease HIII [Cellulosilyticaceae bacterium]